MKRSDEIAAPLLRWYDATKRDLPWRRTPSPYRTLVSEFMLQQTVVATVLPFFERFVARFPDIGALAAASEDDVLAHWSGLGYYSRARNLHRAAKAVVEEHGGVLPRGEEALLALPGVGAYTAAAIASIAYGVRTFALDGNAARVVARLFADDGAIDRPEVRARLRARGEDLVPADRPGDFAQAVMELGARVCTRRPRCDVCPVATACAALRSGEPASLPRRSPRRAKLVVSVALAAVEREGRLLLVRRPAGTLLGGTWTLPAGEPSVGAPDAEACREALRALGLEPVGAATSAGVVRHIFTHRDVTAHVFRQRTRGDLAGGAVSRWMAREELDRLALSSFTRKALTLLL